MRPSISHLAWEVAEIVIDQTEDAFEVGSAFPTASSVHSLINQRGIQKYGKPILVRRVDIQEAFGELLRAELIQRVRTKGAVKNGLPVPFMWAYNVEAEETFVVPAGGYQEEWSSIKGEGDRGYFRERPPKGE